MHNSVKSILFPLNSFNFTKNEKQIMVDTSDFINGTV